MEDQRLAPVLGGIQPGRRQVIVGAAAAALASTAGAPAEAADAPRIVVCNWGGESIKAQGAAWGQPFTQKSGTPVEFDGSGPTFGKIRTMVESKNVVWDVCDANLAVAIDLGRKGYLEKIDWSVVDKSKVRPGFWNDWGVSHFVYSFVLAYDKTKFKDKPPRTWADFWNVKDFPGGRALSARTLGSLEAALMADGVPARKEALYPLDEKRALAKIATLKSNCVYWTSGAESQQLMRQGEVSMALMWHTRAITLRDEKNSRVDFTWNQGLMIPAGWIVPKGNPAGKAVFDFIAFTQTPSTQLDLLRLDGSGPANPATASLVPAALQDKDPAYGANADIQAVADPMWLADNQDRVYNDYVKIISG